MLWVSDDVVGKVGVDVTDERVKWYPVTGEFRTEDAEGALAMWQVTQDTRCVLHIILKAQAGDATQNLYAKFDIRSLWPDCVR